MKFMDLTHFKQKICGDHRDQRVALREAGFLDEAAASRWVSSTCTEPGGKTTELALAKRIRQVRPDLTLATALYIARQAKVRTI